MRDKSCAVQSVSLPGSAGPDATFLRTTFLAARIRLWALLMHTSASNSANCGFAFNHKLKASFTTPETKAALWRDDKRSLV